MKKYRAQIQKASPSVQIKEMEKTKYPPPPLQIKKITQNENITVISKVRYLSEVSAKKSICNSDIKETEKKTNCMRRKLFKKYTWYSG